jgi:hypothetical protein
MITLLSLSSLSWVSMMWELSFPEKLLWGGLAYRVKWFDVIPTRNGLPSFLTFPKPKPALLFQVWFPAQYGGGEVLGMGLQPLTSTPPTTQ